MFFSAKPSLHFCDPFEDTELDKQPLVLHLDPIEGMGCFLTAAETFNQGHRLSCGVLMLRGSSAHSINDRPSYRFFAFQFTASGPLGPY